MSNSPLYPWLITPEGPVELTKTIKDPVTGLGRELPVLGGLTVQENLFLDWAQARFGILEKGQDVFKISITTLMEICYRFLALRLGLADWVKDELFFDKGAFDGKVEFKSNPIAMEELLSVEDQQGRSKAIPLNLLHLIFGFLLEEHFVSLGKPQKLMAKIELVILEELTQSTGPKPTGESSDATQTTLDSPVEPLDDAQSLKSSTPLKATNKPNSKGSTGKGRSPQK